LRVGVPLPARSASIKLDDDALKLELRDMPEPLRRMEAVRTCFERENAFAPPASMSEDALESLLDRLVKEALLVIDALVRTIRGRGKSQR